MEARLTGAPISAMRPGSGDAEATEPLGAGIPLEVLVEREEVRDGPAATRLAAEAGLQLARHLDSAGAPEALFGSLRGRYPLTVPADGGLDPVGQAELALLARRSLDARALHADLAAGLAVTDGSLPSAARSALTAWQAWYDAFCVEPEGRGRSWDPSRMEYRFSAAAGLGGGAEVRLDADEYAGGRLDWDTFDVGHGPALGATGAATGRTLQVLPTPVAYAGQAASRWWQLESASTWFGDLGSAPEDLVHAAVAAFGMVFGDDWQLAPVRVPAGVLLRADLVRVLDTFGETTRVRSTAEVDGPGRVWRFFELTGDASADAADVADRTCPWLLLPATLAGTTESAPVEEVVLRRDETANLGWAAEARVESAAGRTVDRAARSRAVARPRPATGGDTWEYLLGSAPPPHLVPLVPVRFGGGPVLQRGQLAVGSTGRGDGPRTRGALGAVLEPDRPLLIEDAEVPVGGVRVTRSWQLARRPDGGCVLWVGRRKGPASPGNVPASTFDTVRDPAG